MPPSPDTPSLIPSIKPQTPYPVLDKAPGVFVTPDRMDLYHTVAPGETLWRIGKMYGVEVDMLKKANRIYDVTDIDIGRRLKIPDALKRKDVITLYPNKVWDYIIVHHSATESGSCEFFDESHKRRGWNGVGYHFVVDNGTCGKEDGQIETSPRWLKQQAGAHCKADGMNYRGIGICLVGNFSKEHVTPKQMRSLVYLVKTLKNYYKVPLRRIKGHSQVKGANTECPGTKFPWDTFYSLLRR